MFGVPVLGFKYCFIFPNDYLDFLVLSRAILQPTLGSRATHLQAIGQPIVFDGGMRLDQCRADHFVGIS